MKTVNSPPTLPDSSPPLQLSKQRLSDSPLLRFVGRVVRFDERKGYGFIEPSDGGPNIFFHRDDVVYQHADPAKQKRHRGMSHDDGDDDAGAVATKVDTSIGTKEEIASSSRRKSDFRAAIFVGDVVTFGVVWSEEANAPRATMVEPSLHTQN